MNPASCAAPIEFSRLLEYWLGELAQADEEALETHFLGCGHCTRGLEELAALAEGIRTVFRNGALHAVISPAFLESMKAQGLRVREYLVSAGGSVQCTISARDDAVIGRLQASLAGVKRLDLLNVVDGELEIRLPDIPFDPAAREVLFCPSAARLKSMPAHTDSVRLLAVDEAGEKILGEYTFVHTPG